MAWAAGDIISEVIPSANTIACADAVSCTS